MFASVTAEHFEDEVEYGCRYHGEECYGCVFEESIHTPYQQHNPQNRRLTDYRLRHTGIGSAEAEIRWLEETLWADHPQAQHAVKVLKRLVAVYG